MRYLIASRTSDVFPLEIEIGTDDDIYAVVTLGAVVNLCTDGDIFTVVTEVNLVTNEDKLILAPMRTS